MKLTLLVLCGLLPLTSAGVLSSWTWPFRWPGFWGARPGYSSEECRCTSTRISLEEKLVLIGRDNDFNFDGLVTYDDFYYDLDKHYDTNKDGVLSERECLSQFRCAFGDTDQVTQYVCATIMQGLASIPITAYNVEPFRTGVPLDQFLQGNRERYQTFYADRCVNSEISLEEKATRNAANNDFNQDGLVTAEDIRYDLENVYDTNKDGQVSRAEFVQHWVCSYGDSGDYARFAWDTFTQGVDAIPNNYFDGTFANPVPLEDFKASFIELHETFKNREVNNYIQGST